MNLVTRYLRPLEMTFRRVGAIGWLFPILLVTSAAVMASEAMTEKTSTDLPIISIAGSVEGQVDPQFDAFVQSIVHHVRDKMRLSKGQDASLSRPEFTAVRFLYFPLFNRSDDWENLFDSLYEIGNDEEYCFQSPWARIVRHKANGTLRAEIIWSEHQFLIDQELLDTQSPTLRDHGHQISEQEIYQYIDDYEENVLNLPSGEQKTLALEKIKYRVPDEFVWLFSKAWQSTFGLFINEVRSALREFVQKISPSYTKITTDIIDLCSTNKEEYYHVSDILILNSDTNIYENNYKIINIH